MKDLINDERIKQISYKQCYCDICGKSVCETKEDGLDIYNFKIERVDTSRTDRYYREQNFMICLACFEKITDFINEEEFMSRNRENKLDAQN